MPLADEIARVRDVALQDLVAAYDYYADTKAAWQVVQPPSRVNENRCATLPLLLW